MEAARYTLEQFEAALAGVEEKRPSNKGAGGEKRSTGTRLSLDHPRLLASRPELVIEALQVWPNNAETNPTHLDFVKAMAAIKSALGPKREDYYGEVLKWALGYPQNDGKYVRSTVWDSIKDAEVGAEWLFDQARPYGFCGDAQDDFADPGYPPESFYGLDADGIRARIDELLILKFGWPHAYEEVRAHLEIYSIIDLAELDALVAKRAPAYGIATAKESTSSANDVIKATPFTWQNPKNIPRREWLYGRHFIRKYLSTTIAPGGVGKSALLTVEILAMVTGKNLLGELPASPLRVWYWNGEDPPDELQRRLAAACLHYGISPEDIGDRLFVNSGRETPIVVAQDDKSGLKIAQPLMQALRDEIIAKQIDVLVIDPFVSSHSVSENDNVRINAVLRQWAMLADATGCAIELAHHTRKPAAGQAAEYSVDDARGAGAMIAAVRSARTLNVMTKDEAGKLGFGEDRRRLYFRVDNGKANLAPPAERSTWRCLIGVQLGNGESIAHAGDSVGVVTAWEWPDPTEDVTPEDTRAVQQAVAAGEWRENPQAKDWVGKPIADALALDLADPSVRAKVKELQKSWVKEGVLKVVERKNAKRETKRFVEVGKRKVAA
jgi:hypothetical protein